MTTTPTTARPATTHRLLSMTTVPLSPNAIVVSGRIPLNH